MTLFPCNLEKGKTDLESPQGAEVMGQGHTLVVASLWPATYLSWPHL